MKILSLFSLVALTSQLSAQEGLRGFELEYALQAQAAGDNFGKAVAYLGDINNDRYDDFLVGADFSDASGYSNSGSVYVYSGATGEQIYRIDGLGAEYKFGGAISRSDDIDGDSIPDFIVGARFANSASAGAAGVVYVYSGATGEELFNFQGTVTNGFFGIDVAGVGDTNLDGIPDLLVGSRGIPSSGGNQPGKAFLYSGADGQIIRQISGTSSGDSFGDSVAPLGDVDLDGAADFLIGAPGENTVYIYSGLTGNIIRKFSSFASGSDAGFDVASATDLTGDSIPEVLIGEPAFRKVYVYSGSDGTLLGTLEGATDLASFGSSVSSVGDIDQDGYADILVGANDATPGGVKTGAAVLYSVATGKVLEQFEGEVAKEKYGSSVSYAGDINRDGLPDFLIGARHGDVNGLSQAGYAELYRPIHYINLTIDGAVPETLIVKVSFANKGDQLAIFIGHPGSSTSSFANCTDLAFDLDLATPDRVYQAGPNGRISFMRAVPPSAIGWAVQAVNLTTCEVSNPITL